MDLLNLFRKTGLFALGAAILLKEEGDKVVDQLVKKGEAVHREWSAKAKPPETSAE